jgi:hypothetical protein
MAVYRACCIDQTLDRVVGPSLALIPYNLGDDGYSYGSWSTCPILGLLPLHSVQVLSFDGAEPVCHRTGAFFLLF